MARWHLKKNPKKQNGKEYAYYNIAENFTDSRGKHQKKLIKYLGVLSNERADIIRLALRAFNGEDLFLVDFKAIKYVEAKRYLDVALVSLIYDQLGIGQVYNLESEKELSTADVAKILILSRCLDPQANYLTVDWFRDSYLPALMNVDPEKYNKDKIFHELEPIYNRREHLQKKLLSLSRQFHDDDLELYFFDATTSYFEGECCEMAEGAKEKTTGYQDKVILILLVTDKKGFPITWQVFSGAKHEASKFKDIGNQMCKKFGIKEVTFCFDRGIASASNFDFISDVTLLNSKYISGLDRNQMEDVFDLDSFAKNIRPTLIVKYREQETTHIKKRYPTLGFSRFGADRFFKDLGVKNGKRHVISFNINIFEKEQKTRGLMIEKVKQEFDKINLEVLSIKGDRESEPLEKRIEKLISKYRLQKIIGYNIVPLAVKCKNDFIQGYKIEYWINQDAFTEAEKHDGTFIFVTNHIEVQNAHFIVPAQMIVAHYKDKYVIENAFRYLKSFADLRPFFVRLDDHVNAHIDICMCSYFISLFIYYKLHSLGISLETFYKTIKDYSRVCMLETKTGTREALLRVLPKNIKQIINTLGAQRIIDEKHLKFLEIIKN